MNELRYIIMLLIVSSLVMPTIVFGASQITVTFNPEGDVQLDIHPTALNFTEVIGGASKTHADVVTVYNNGSGNMLTQVQTDTHTADMTLDGDGSPGSDAYSIEAVNGTCSGCDMYLTEELVTLDTTIGPSSSDTSYFELFVGSPLTANHSWQTTYINFSGQIT